MSLLKRVTIERSPEGRFAVLREHETGGERFVCDDLLEVYETISAAYRPDGTPRPLPTGSKGEEGNRGDITRAVELLQSIEDDVLSFNDLLAAFADVRADERKGLGVYVLKGDNEEVTEGSEYITEIAPGSIYFGSQRDAKRFCGALAAYRAIAKNDMLREDLIRVVKLVPRRVPVLAQSNLEDAKR